jgi:DNA-binding transcriptional LysR family regulator
MISIIDLRYNARVVFAIGVIDYTDHSEFLSSIKCLKGGGVEISQLRAFLSASENGSFRRAAESLRISQPSLSARVYALEQELGVSLFHRMGRGVRLTEMGKTFLPYAERSIESLRQGKDVIYSALNDIGGTLNMASARNIGTYALPTMLEQFRRQYPDINVHISIGRSSDVLQLVLNDEVQLGLARALNHHDIVTIHLYDEDISLATSPDHPFAKRGEASIYDVAREPLILYDKDSSYFVLINQVCRAAGIIPRVEMTLDSIEATKHLVELGMGISFLPRSGVRQELERDTIRLIPLSEGYNVTLPTAVLIRRAKEYSPSVIAFLRVLKQIYGAEVPMLVGLESVATQVPID